MAVAWYWYEIHADAPTTQFDPSDLGDPETFGTYEGGGSAQRSFKYGQNRLESAGDERRLVFHRNLSTGPPGNTWTIPLARANGQAHGQFNLVARLVSTPLDDTSLGTMAAYNWNTTPAPGAVIIPGLRTFRALPQVLYSEDPFFTYALDVTGMADWMLVLEGYEAFDSRAQFTSNHTIYTGNGTITFT
jgi:hypothetical protein